MQSTENITTEELQALADIKETANEIFDKLITVKSDDPMAVRSMAMYASRYLKEVLAGTFDPIDPIWLGRLSLVFDACVKHLPSSRFVGSDNQNQKRK